MLNSPGTAGATDVPHFSSLAEARRAAVDLETEGRHLEAIRVLTEANRSDPRLGVERELVKLRQRAMVANNSSGFAEWPPRIDGPLAPSGTLPEVDAAELSADVVRRGIIGNGAVMVRNLLDSAKIGELNAGIDRALAAFQSWQPKTKGTAEQERYFKPVRPVDPDDWEAKHLRKDRQFLRETKSVWTADSPKMLFEVLDTFEQTGVLSVIEQYLGERPAASIKKLTLRIVDPDQIADWHQDGAFLGEGIRSVNLWVALTDCGVDAPGMDLIPRRLDDIVETGSGGAIFDWTVGPELIDEVAGDASVIRPVFRAGDAIMFDERFLHRTAADADMTTPRYAIESWFFAPSAYRENDIAILV